MGADAVDFEQLVAAAQSGADGGGVGVRLIDEHIPFFFRLVDDGTDAAISLAEHHFEVFLLLFRDVDRIGIELFEHGVDAGELHPFQRKGIDIAAAEFAEDGILDLDPLAEFELLGLTPGGRAGQQQRRNGGEYRVFLHVLYVKPAQS